VIWGIYGHVPWCQLRCPYCNFYVEVERSRAPWEAFADRMVAEVAWRRARHGFEGSPTTIYLGGGTPSRMPTRVLAGLLEGLGGADAHEITVEANPEDVHADWLEALLDAGVHRVSLGVQTLNPGVAKRLGRASSVRQARSAMALLGGSRLRSWSADLLFASPEQSLATLDEDLSALLAYNPPHVSLYGLTIEPETPFERMRADGRLKEVEPEAWREMHDRLTERLEGTGRMRYEVSNFALPGHDSRHNQLYWTDAPYLGAGPSAHGYGPRRERWSNVSDVRAWLREEDPTLEEEAFHPERYAADLLISGMRGIHGVEVNRLRAVGLLPSQEMVQRLASAGLLRLTTDRIALNPDAFPVSDSVVRALIESLEPL
jgi:oxygen-independent coproporphyrinogen-3 oxidase